MRAHGTNKNAARCYNANVKTWCTSGNNNCVTCWEIVFFSRRHALVALLELEWATQEVMRLDSFGWDIVSHTDFTKWILFYYIKENNLPRERCLILEFKKIYNHTSRKNWLRFKSFNKNLTYEIKSFFFLVLLWCSESVKLNKAYVFFYKYWQEYIYSNWNKTLIFRTIISNLQISVKFSLKKFIIEDYAMKLLKSCYPLNLVTKHLKSVPVFAKMKLID